MASRRKSHQPSQPLVERFQEERLRIAKQDQKNHQRWGALIAERRTAAGLSRQHLAARTGLSDSTIRNVEKGRCKSISPKTLNLLRSIPELRLPLSLDQEDQAPDQIGYRTIWLPNYDPSYLTRLAQSALLCENARIPYDSIHNSRKSTDAYLLKTFSGVYGQWVRRNSGILEAIVDSLLMYSGSRVFDFTCFTIGYGWLDLKLISILTSKNPMWLGSIRMISPCIELIHSAIQAAGNMFLSSGFLGSKIDIILGTHESYIDAIKRRPSCSNVNVYILQATFMNHDNCSVMIDGVSKLMNKGDVMIFDVNLPCGLIGNARSIVAKDPRLSGEIPFEHVRIVESIIELSIQEVDPSVKGFSWKYGLVDECKSGNQSLASYSVNMQGELYRENSAPQRVSALRIHRHDLYQLQAILFRNGLRLLCEFPYGDERTDQFRYPSAFLLFKKFTDSN